MSDQKRPEWMTSIAGIVDPQEYLLGRKIDKTFELSQHEKSEKAREARANLIAQDKLKLTGDPLLELERRKLQLKIDIISNPVKLRRLRERLLREEREKQGVQEPPDTGSKSHPSVAEKSTRRISPGLEHKSRHNRSPSSSSSTTSMSSSSSSMSTSSSSSSSSRSSSSSSSTTTSSSSSSPSSSTSRSSSSSSRQVTRQPNKDPPHQNHSRRSTHHKYSLDRESFCRSRYSHHSRSEFSRDGEGGSSRDKGRDGYSRSYKLTSHRKTPSRRERSRSRSRRK